ncbi:MAG: hypothetical protein V2A34_08045 [Lentisphaerota bacterium]
MRSCRYLVVVACVVAGLAVSASAKEKKFSVGAKVWNSAPTYAADSTWMYGGLFSVDFNQQLWLSGQYLYGKRDYENGARENEHDAEGVFGTSFKFIDVGGGVRYVKFQSDTWNVNAYGPMCYLGAGTPFGDLPIGWYASGAWMFYDFGDWDATDDKFEHFNLEGGLSFVNDYVIATLGYRYKDYYKQSDYKEKGFTGSVSYRF